MVRLLPLSAIALLTLRTAANSGPTTSVPTTAPTLGGGSNAVCATHTIEKSSNTEDWSPLEMTRAGAFPTWWLQYYRKRATMFVKSFVPNSISTIPYSIAGTSGEVDLTWDFSANIDALPQHANTMDTGKRFLLATYFSQLGITAIPGILLVAGMLVCFMPCCCCRMCGEICGMGRFQACCCTVKACGLCRLQDNGGRCVSESTNNWLPDVILVTPLVCWTRVCESHRNSAAKKKLKELDTMNPMRKRRLSHLDAREDEQERDELKRMCFLGSVRCGRMRPDRDWPLLPGCSAVINRYSLTSDLPAPICSCCSRGVIYALQALLLAGLAGCGTWGVVKVALLVKGVGGATQEVACVVDDAIVWIEQLLVPIFNISELASASISGGLAAVATAQALGPSLNNIVSQMNSTSESMLHDTCGFAAAGVPWPPEAMSGMSRSVKLASVEIDEATKSMVMTLDDTLSSVSSQLVVANETLTAAVQMADMYTSNVLEILRDRGKEYATEAQKYINVAREYQQYSGYFLYSIVWGAALLQIIAFVSLTACTECYRCKERLVLEDTDAHGEQALDWKSTWVHFNHRKAYVHNCLQCLGVWGVHVTTLVVYVFAIVSFLLVAFATPMSVAISDVCVVTDNFVNNVPMWMNESGLLTNELSISAVDSCMQQTSITEALKIEEKLFLVNSLNFSSIVDMNIIGALDFTQLPRMTAEVNKLNVTALGYDRGKATQLLDGINAILANPSCFAQFTWSPTWRYTLPDCTPTAFPVESSDPVHTSCMVKDNMLDDPSNPSTAPNGCRTQLALYIDHLISLRGGRLCSKELISQMQKDVGGVNNSTQAFGASIAQLHAQLTSVMDSIQPILDNIEKLSELGNCGFVRRRVDAILRSICTTALEGMLKIDGSFCIIGVILGILVIVGQLAAERFRKFRPDTWIERNIDSDDEDSEGGEWEHVPRDYNNDVVFVNKASRPRQVEMSTRRTSITRGRSPRRL